MEGPGDIARLTWTAENTNLRKIQKCREEESKTRLGTEMVWKEIRAD